MDTAARKNNNVELLDVIHAIERARLFDLQAPVPGMSWLIPGPAIMRTSSRKRSDANSASSQLNSQSRGARILEVTIPVYDPHA